MKHISLALVAALASVSLTACLDDGSDPQDQDPQIEPGQIDLAQPPADQADIDESVDLGTSALDLPHRDILESGRLGSTTISTSVSNSKICCVSLKLKPAEISVGGVK